MNVRSRLPEIEMPEVLSTALDHADDPVVIVGDDRRIVHCARRWPSSAATSSRASFTLPRFPVAFERWLIEHCAEQAKAMLGSLEVKLANGEVVKRSA